MSATSVPRDTVQFGQWTPDPCVRMFGLGYNVVLAVLGAVMFTILVWMLMRKNMTGGQVGK